MNPTYSPSPTSPSVIPADNLQGQNPIQTIPQPDLTRFYQDLTTNSVQDAQNYKTAQTETATAKNNLMTSVNSVNTLQDLVSGKVGDTANLNAQYDLAGKQSLIDKYNNQILAYSNNANMIPIQMQKESAGRGITDAGLAPLQAGALRENAIQALTASAYRDAAQSDFNSAQKKIEQAINAKYAGAEAQLAAKQQQFTNNTALYNTLSSSEKTTWDKVQANITQQQKQIDDKKAIDTGIQSIGMTLSKYGVDPNIVKDVLSSTSINDAMIKAGNNLKDPKAQLELQSLKADIAFKQAQTAKTYREQQLLGQPTIAEQKATTQAIKEAKGSLPAAQEKIDAIDLLKNGGIGLSSRVGPNVFSRGVVGPLVGGAVLGAGAGPVGAIVGGLAGAGQGIAASFGAGQDFSGAVHRITAGLTLDNLIAAKQNGATFGALSDGERQMLASSASNLNDWEIKDDKGNGTGYWNIDEASFKKELTRIQDLTKQAVKKSQGTLMQPDETSMLDSIYQTPVSSGQYFK